MRAKEIGSKPILRPMPGPWGKAIKALRDARHLNRATVAKRIGMTATTYGRIERGHHTLTSKLQDIADVFEVPIEDVLMVRATPISRLQGIDRASAPPGSQPHAQGPAFSAEQAEEIRQLRTQVDILTQQIAELVATRATRHDGGRKRSAATRAGQPLRSSHARKPR